MAWIDKRQTDFSAEEKKKKEEQARSQQQAQQEWAQPRSTNASTGEISIAGNARSKGETAAHEAGHIIERHAPEQYRSLSDTALTAAAQTDQNALSRRFEQKLSDGYSRDELRSEVTNDILGAIAGDASAIRRLTSDRTGRTGALISTFENLKARAKDALGGRVRTANGLELSYTQLNELTDNLRAGLDAARGRYVPEKNVGESEAGEIRHLFSPRGDQEQKRAAIEMERQGAAPEEIWRATGWGRGLDGKWRTEIDDSGSEFNSLGNAMLDKEDFAVRRQELYNKWFDGSITDEELGELNDLDDRYSEVSKQRAKMPKTVRDYLDHEELYKRHPELGDMSMSIEPVEEGTRGFYSPNSKSIALSDTRLHEPTYHGRATTLHELQHAIQDRSAFAGGSSPEEFGGDETKYYNTAGEIEARDVERRRRLTPEQRRNTFPESMKPNENAVFADGGRSMAIGYTNTNKPVVMIKNDIKSSRHGISDARHTPEMRRILDQYENSVDPDLLRFAITVKDNPDDNRSNFVISTVSDRAAADIKRLTGIDVTGFKNAIKSNSIRHIVKGHGENGDTDTSMSDIKDIARMPYVIDNYDDVELLPTESKEYRDRSQKPAPMIKFRKRIDGTYYVVEAVPDTRKSQLPVVTAYIEKAAPQTGTVERPSPDARSASADTAINNSVSQPDGIVNTQDDIKFSQKTPAGAKAYFKRQYWDSLHPTDRMYLADFNRDIDTIFDLYRSAEAEGSDPMNNAELREAAHDLAEHIVSNTYTAAGDADTRDAIRREIRGVHIYVSPRGRTSGELGADGYGSFRKEAFGADVYLTPDRDLGISADTYYGELQGQYGKDYFPDYNTPEEMIRHIVEFMKEKPVGERSYRDSDTEGIAEGILSDVERCLYPEPEELSAAGEAVRSYVSGARPRDRAELYQRVDAAYKTVETAVRRGNNNEEVWQRACNAVNSLADAIAKSNGTDSAESATGMFVALGEEAMKTVPQSEQAKAKKDFKAAAGRLSNLYTVSGQNKHYSSEFRKALEKKKEKFRYNPKAIGPQYESAQAMIEEEGADTVLNAFFRDQPNKPWVSESVATAAALIEHYTQAGDHDTAADIFVFARPYTTRAGQASQAWALINRLSKEGKLMAVSRENIGRKEKAIEDIEKKKAKDRASKQQFQTELDEARRRDRKAREEKDSAAEVELPTPPTEPGAYKEEPVPPRGRGKRDSGSFIERMRARIAAGSTPPAESSGKKQPRRRSIEDGKRTRRTKPAAVTDSNRAAVKSGIDRLRTLLRVPANERIDPDIHYSRKSISDKISSEVKDRILRLIEDGRTEKALAAIDGLRLDEYGYEGLSQPDRDFLSQVTQSMEYGYYGGEDSISEDRRAEIYTLLRSGSYAAAEDMIDGYYNSVLSKSDLKYLSAVMDEYEDRRSLFDDESIFKNEEHNKPLGRAIYSPSTEELLSKPDAVATEITAPYAADENGHIADRRAAFKDAADAVRNSPWIGQVLTNEDEDFAAQHGALTGVISMNTLRKGSSHNTPFTAREYQVMQQLDEVFRRGKVIKAAESSLDNDGISAVYTILSPVRFEDGSVGVVKLNVKGFENPGNPNKVYENKILDIQDIELNKKTPEASKSLPPAGDGSENIDSGVSSESETLKSLPTAEVGSENIASDSYTMSIAQMLEFVKNFDVKYLPEDYFTSEAWQERKRRMAGADPLTASGGPLPLSGGASGEGANAQPPQRPSLGDREPPQIGTPFRKVGQPGFNERAIDTETGEAAVKEAQRRLGEDINAIRAGNTEADNAEFDRELGEARRADAENDKAADWFKGIEDEAARQWKKTKLGKKGAPDPRSFEEKVLDRWAGRGKVGSANYIPHQVLDYALETLDEIERLKEKGGKEEFIAKIIKLSEHRHTAGNQFNILKGRLEKYDVEPLTEMATMQVFGMIADTKKTSFWQYLSTGMAIGDLVKATTMGRNVLSNAVFSTVEKTSNNLAILPDILMSLRTGNRTVGFQSGVFGKGVLRSNLKERLDWARDAYIDIALGINRANYSESRWGMDSSRRTFKGQNVPGRIYASLERGMGYGLNVTDQWTKGGLYNRTKRSLADLKGTPFTAEEIEELAMEEALYATFQDDNFISRRLIAIRNALNGSVNFGLGDVVIKYAQVPGSLIMRSLEYSPAGAFKAMFAIGQAVMEARSTPSADGKKQHISAARQRQIALTIGRLMNTTILVALGALMHSLGIITGAESEDKDAKNLEKSEGLSNLQLNMSALGRFVKSGFRDTGGLQNGDMLMQLTWLEPMNSLLEMGVEAAKVDWGGEGSIWGKIGRVGFNTAQIAAAASFADILDFPALSTINELISDLNYGMSPIEIAVSTAVDTGLRFVPGPVRQAAKGFDIYQRNAYSEGSGIENTFAGVAASIPGLSQNVPASVTPWGERKMKAKSIAANMINELLLPGRVSVYQTNNVADEVKRLAAFDPEVIPPKVERYFTETLTNGDQVRHDLNGRDYEAYSINMGQNISKALSDLMRSEEYQSMADGERISSIKAALKDARELTRNEYAAAQRGEEYKEAAKLVGQDIVDKLDEDMKKIKFQSDTGMKYMDIAGTKYQLSDKLLGEMNDIITSKTNDYRQKILIDGAKIEDVLDMKVDKMFYYKDMTEEQRKNTESSIKGTVSKKNAGGVDITPEEQQMLDDFRSGKTAYTKEIEIKGSYYDYDTETRQKIISKIDSKAKEDAQNAIKSRVPTEGTPVYKLYQSRGFTERDSENPAEIYPKPEHHVKQKAVKPERSTDWGRVMELLGMNGTSARAEDESVEYKGKSLGIDLNKVPQFTAALQRPGIGEARPTAEPTPKPTLAAARPQPTFTPTPTAEPQQTAARPSLGDARTIGFSSGGAMPTLTAAANASRPSLGDARPADFNSGGAVPILTSAVNNARQEAATPQYAVPTWRATPSTAAHRPSLGQGRTVTGLIIEPEREAVQAAAPSTTTTARAGSRRSSSGGGSRRSGGGRRSSSGGRSSTARSTAPSLGAASRSYTPALDAPRAGSAAPSLDVPGTAGRSYAPTLASASAERRAAESYRQRGYTPAA